MTAPEPVKTAMKYFNATRRVYRSSALFLALIYLAVGFYPFHIKPYANTEQDNGAVRLPDGRIQFTMPGIVYTKEAPSWLQEAIATSNFEISLEVRTANLEQDGPARIFTLSSDRSHRNFTIMQWGPNLSVRIRTPDTSDNGLPSFRVMGAFKGLEWHNVHVRIRPKHIEIDVDGRPHTIAEMPERPLKDWNHSYRLALGNELSGDYPWLGEIRKAVVHVGDQSFDYVTSGKLLFPEQFRIKNYHAWQVVPFADISSLSTALRDCIINLAGFVPFGWLVAKSRQSSHSRRISPRSYWKWKTSSRKRTAAWPPLARSSFAST